MTDHHDVLGELNKHIPLRDKLVAAHQSVKHQFSFIVRIAIALYEPETSILKTYVHSSGDDNPLEHYQSSLEDAPSLKNILKKRITPCYQQHGYFRRWRK